jgi:exodeoxyribonuclease-3
MAQGHAIVVGDFNVAPLENDVWSHKAMLKIVSHTPIETEKLTDVMKAGPWVDAMRRFVPAQEQLFTWWSYRSADWANANKGRRLDHVWATTRLADSIRGMEVVKEARGWERPSDHVPVIVDIDH